METDVSKDMFLKKLFFLAFSIVLFLHSCTQYVINIKGIAITLLWLLDIRDLALGHLQSLPVPVEVQGDR